MRFKLLILALTALLFFAGCSSDENNDETTQQSAQNQMASDVHKVTIEEIIQANAYTYLRVTEDDKEDSMLMNNFHSQDLNRDFESVWFVQTVSPQPITANPMMGSQSPHSNVKPEADESISIEPVAGGITIAQLFDNRADYDGKQVKIKGKVVKVNNGIMGRNWVHIQDGTGDENNYDLTLTTDDNVQVGQIVVVEGYVTLNKDFGSGYKYDIILEDSKVSPNDKISI
jgi:uncharacterized protein YcfL